jgi:hypothetical protein
MLNYNTENHSWSEFLDELNTEISKLSFPFKVKHKFLGDCDLTAITATDTSIFGSFKTTTEIKRYDLNFLCEKNYLTFTSPDDCILILGVIDSFFQSIATRDDELRELRRQAEEKRLQEAEEKKKAAAEEKRRQNIAAKIKAMKPESLTTDYELLGWLAKNVSTISAVVPSDLDPWFVKNFGSVAHTVVESDAKTSNGNPMKYSISFKASFKNDIPAVLQSKAGVKKKVIDSVSFIWDLIENHGFRFGKSQDIEAIKKTVPATYLSEFETGIA